MYKSQIEETSDKITKKPTQAITFTFLFQYSSPKQNNEKEAVI